MAMNLPKITREIDLPIGDMQFTPDIAPMRRDGFRRKVLQFRDLFYSQPSSDVGANANLRRRKAIYGPRKLINERRNDFPEGIFDLVDGSPLTACRALLKGLDDGKDHFLHVLGHPLPDLISLRLNIRQNFVQRDIFSSSDRLAFPSATFARCCSVTS